MTQTQRDPNQLSAENQKAYREYVRESSNSYAVDATLDENEGPDLWYEHLDRCHAKFDELLASQQPVVSRWVPGPEEDYASIGEQGDVKHCTNYNQDYTDLHLAAENCWPDDPAAEAESRRTIARRYYERRCRECNGGSQLPAVKDVDRFVYIIIRNGTDYFARGFADRLGLHAVITRKEAEMIRAEMEALGYLEPFFGEAS